MHRRWKGIRRALGAPLSALVLFAGAAGPFLDRAELAARTVMVSAHDPASCAAAHDHRLCIQVGANHALSSPDHIRAGCAPIQVAVSFGAAASAPWSVLADGHPTRGPPSV